MSWSDWFSGAFDTPKQHLAAELFRTFVAGSLKSVLHMSFEKEEWRINVLQTKEICRRMRFLICGLLGSLHSIRALLRMNRVDDVAASITEVPAKPTRGTKLKIRSKQKGRICCNTTLG
jgi:hypothetical protein